MGVSPLVEKAQLGKIKGGVPPQGYTLRSAFGRQRHWLWRVSRKLLTYHLTKQVNDEGKQSNSAVTLSRQRVESHWDLSVAGQSFLAIYPRQMQESGITIFSLHCSQHFCVEVKVKFPDVSALKIHILQHWDMAWASQSLYH